MAVKTAGDNLTTLYDRAKKVLVAGAGAANRVYSALGQPIYLDRADGARVWDVNGKEYIDYHTCAGAGLFGYNHPRIRKAVEKAMELGFFCNWDTPYHVELAELFAKVFPCAERTRISNTGTEATMGAIRMARGYTGRQVVIRMDGHFHGMHEMIWYNHNKPYAANANGEVNLTPDSDGFPKGLDKTLVNIPFNDVEALEGAVKRHKDQVAAVILEPASFNCGCYMPREGYLQEVRKICDREGIVLIFDEVITGLRMRPGSAQAYFGVTPDLATVAKAVGGGFQTAAVVGKAKVMEGALAPVGKVGMSGTYTGSLMAVLVAIECLKMSQEPWYFDHIDALAGKLYGGIDDLMRKHGVKGHVRGLGARFGIYFGVENPDDDFDWRKVAKSYDPLIHERFLLESLERGIFFLDGGRGISPPHKGFSIMHTQDDVAETLTRFDDVFKAIK